MLFSIGGVAEWTVVDLFAGTGALGLEASSRGASSVTFVERDRAMGDLIEANLSALGLEGSVVRADAVSWPAAMKPVDLVLADPPYGFDEWELLLERIQADYIVVESDREIHLGDRWEVLRSKRYGATFVLVAEAAALQES